jgi:hypothetical protein
VTENYSNFEVCMVVRLFQAGVSERDISTGQRVKFVKQTEKKNCCAISSQPLKRNTDENGCLNL